MNQDSAQLIDILSKEIYANDARDPIGAIKTIINGKRDVGFINLTKDLAKKLEKHLVRVIPITMTSPTRILSIIYRDEAKAMELYNIIKRKGGYLSDNTPNEAREIGKLLGYNEKSIEEYIYKKYNKKPPIMPIPKILI